MKFKIGQKVKVHPIHGADFYDGEIVKIVGFGCEDDPNCYRAVSLDDYDEWEWYIWEDEMFPITNGDYIRSMNNEELSNFIAKSFNLEVVKNHIKKFLDFEFNNENENNNKGE